MKTKSWISRKRKKRKMENKQVIEKPEGQEPGVAESEYMDDKQRRAFEAKLKE